MSHAAEIAQLEALLKAIPDSTEDWETAHENDSTAVTFYQNILKVLTLPERVKPQPYETRHEIKVTETDEGMLVTLTTDYETVIEGYGMDMFTQIVDVMTADTAEKIILDPSCSLLLGEPEEKSIIHGKEYPNLPKGFSQENYYGHKRHSSIYKYMNHLQSTLQYLKNPTDFYTAYYWVEHHVLFWTTDKNGYTKHNLSGSGYQPYMAVMKTHDTNKTVIALEAGESLGQHTCHDHSLDVYAPTFEEAYIKLAARIHEKFTWDGVEREQ